MSTFKKILKILYARLTIKSNYVPKRNYVSYFK